MVFSITDSLLQRNDILIKEIMRLRKKNNKLAHELKFERRKAIHLNLVSTSTQTTFDLYQIPKSPVSREKKTPTKESFRHLVPSQDRSPHQKQGSSPSHSPVVLLSKEKVLKPSLIYSTNESSPGVKLKFEDSCALSIDNVDKNNVESPSAMTSSKRRPRRNYTGAPLSYKEPSLNTKIRKGHKFFVKK